MIVYIEAIKYNNILTPFNEDAACAFIGYRDKGAKIIMFEHIDEVPLSRDILVVACVETTKEWFNRMNWNVNYDFSYPLGESFCGRHVDRHSKERLLEGHPDSTYKWFIKPVETKQYPHDVILSNKELETYLKDKEGEFYMSPYVDIISEWRVYIINKSIVGIKNYIGNIFKPPHPDTIKEFIDSIEYKTYALDVYLNQDEDTFMMECNDAWSIGNYGLSARDYTRFLSERWVELLKENPAIPPKKTIGRLKQRINEIIKGMEGLGNMEI